MINLEEYMNKVFLSHIHEKVENIPQIGLIVEPTLYGKELMLETMFYNNSSVCQVSIKLRSHSVSSEIKKPFIFDGGLELYYNKNEEFLITVENYNLTKPVNVFFAHYGMENKMIYKCIPQIVFTNCHFDCEDLSDDYNVTYDRCAWGEL